MVGEAGGEAEVGEGRLWFKHLFAGRANAEAMDVFADTFADAAAKDAGEMDRMNAGFAREFVESEAAAMFGF